MAAQTVPTKGNLLAAKKSLELSRTGFELLDRKRNILIREMMLLIDRASAIQEKIDVTYAQAYKSLQMANIASGLCFEVARTVPLDDNLNVAFRSVMGVELPIVTSDPIKVQPRYGFTQSDSSLDEAYMKFTKVKELTLVLAEVETSVYRLATNIAKTQKRANSLKNVTIPRYERIVKDIQDVLDEKEREEFTRLKVIKRKQEREKSQPTGGMEERTPGISEEAPELDAGRKDSGEERR